VVDTLAVFEAGERSGKGSIDDRRVLGNLFATRRVDSRQETCRSDSSGTVAIKEYTQATIVNLTDTSKYVESTLTLTVGLVFLRWEIYRPTERLR